MWQEGAFEIDNIKFRYRIKLHDGIMKKLLINEDHNSRSLIVVPVAFYDDGWEVKPNDSIGKKALKHVLELFEIKTQ